MSELRGWTGSAEKGYFIRIRRGQKPVYCEKHGNEWWIRNTPMTFAPTPEAAIIKWKILKER